MSFDSLTDSFGHFCLDLFCCFLFQHHQSLQEHPLTRQGSLEESHHSSAKLRETQDLRLSGTKRARKSAIRDLRYQVHCSVPLKNIYFNITSFFPIAAYRWSFLPQHQGSQSNKTKMFHVRQVFSQKGSFSSVFKARSLNH